MAAFKPLELGDGRAAIVSDGPGQEAGKEEEKGVGVTGHEGVWPDAEVGAARVPHELRIPFPAADAGVLHCLVRHRSHARAWSFTPQVQSNTAQYKKRRRTKRRGAKKMDDASHENLMLDWSSHCMESEDGASQATLAQEFNNM